MTLRVINNPKFLAKTGFTKGQFRKLDDLYCRAASLKILNYRTVECDFDEEVASYTYHISEHKPPILQFVIRKVGPQTMMYELYKEGKGRIAKSGVFDRAFEKLQSEIKDLC
ncbi:MAG: hypothetical protein KDJ75_02685 [Alphaproteobacteria bacterium]|nr:hypothetical protein [Alphaproteobacteria bacterium]